MSNFPKLFKKFFGWLEFYEKNKRKSVTFRIWADGWSNTQGGGGGGWCTDRPWTWAKAYSHL